MSLNELLSTLTVADLLGFCTVFFTSFVGIVKGLTVFNEHFHIFQTPGSQTKESLKQIGKELNDLNKIVRRNREELLILLDSDKNRTRSEIIREYQRCIERGSIDYKTLDYLQKQYSSYQREGGNSYIADLMAQIERLPIKN